MSNDTCLECGLSEGRHYITCPILEAIHERELAEAEARVAALPLELQQIIRTSTAAFLKALGTVSEAMEQAGVTPEELERVAAELEAAQPPSEEAPSSHDSLDTAEDPPA